MKSDLDRLMRERSIDTLVVTMHEASHPAFRWLTNGAKVTRGYLFKRAAQEPLLIRYPMERDEAALAGIPTRSIHDFDYRRAFSTHSDQASAYAELFSNVLREIHTDGPIAFCGNGPLHLYLDLADELESRGWEMHHARGDDIIQLARKKKDAAELEIIASVGARTEEVVELVRQVLREASIESGRLIHHGKPLLIGDLKAIVSTGIATRGMVEDHDTILSQGRDAAIPHSRGTATDPVLASVPLVLDIFPADRASGYFFDLTRTFCAGPIPSELSRIHQAVLAAFLLASDTMRAGTPASGSQSLVCDFFESRGFRTTRSHPATTEGYVHSLGHGVGLELHERPSFSLSGTNRDTIEVGDVLTIEPGLYFPDRQIGVRIEDTLFIREDGKAESFCRSDRSLAP